MSVSELLDACRNRDKDKIEMLLQRGVDVNSRFEPEGLTILMYVIHFGYNEDIIELILQYGADVNLKDKYDKTAIMWACERCYLNAVELILQRGADVNAKDIHGRTALMHACFYGYNNTDIVQILLQYGADINAKDNGYGTVFNIGLSKKCGKIFRDYQIVRSVGLLNPDSSIMKALGQDLVIDILHNHFFLPFEMLRDLAKPKHRKEAQRWNF